jgi:hypothetical protein
VNFSDKTIKAIEQDLFRYTNPKTRQSRSVLAHTPDFHGDEPSLETYFFERICPIVLTLRQRNTSICARYTKFLSSIANG